MSMQLLPSHQLAEVSATQLQVHFTEFISRMHAYFSYSIMNSFVSLLAEECFIPAAAAAAAAATSGNPCLLHPIQTFGRFHTCSVMHHRVHHHTTVTNCMHSKTLCDQYAGNHYSLSAIRIRYCSCIAFFIRVVFTLTW